MSIPVITIIGKSGAGKTTLLEKLIPELKRRGYRIGAIKHHSHFGFEIDQPGKDSWRFAQAGSEHVIIAAPDKIASYRQLDGELSLDEITAQVEDLDLILVEGYKQAGKPSIEIFRSLNSLGLISNPEQLLAVVTDAAPDFRIPHYGLDDVQGIADLIETRFLRQDRVEAQSKSC